MGVARLGESSDWDWGQKTANWRFGPFSLEHPEIFSTKAIILPLKKYFGGRHGDLKSHAATDKYSIKYSDEYTCEAGIVHLRSWDCREHRNLRPCVFSTFARPTFRGLGSLPSKSDHSTQWVDTPPAGSTAFTYFTCASIYVYTRYILIYMCYTLM
jgi:hypothetical protein